MTDVQEFLLPDLGEGLEEAEIVHWLVAVGDRVELNQDIVEVETAKAIVTVPSPFVGTVTELGGEVGALVAVGSMLLRVRPDGEASADPEQSGDGADADGELQPLVGYGREKNVVARRRRIVPSGSRTAARPGPSTTTGAGSMHVAATPLVRRLAKELAVDLTLLAPGTGRDGAVTREDVRSAAAGTHPQVSAAAPDVGARHDLLEVPGFRGRYPGEVEVVGGIRRRIIEKMERSRRDIPSATISRDADVTALRLLRQELCAQAAAFDREIRITPFHIVMRAVVVALRRFPVLNARYDAEAGTIELLRDINLGFAVDTPRGLLVPNLRQAQGLSIVDLATGVVDLAGRARAGRAEPGELVGGTFTVNNYGAFGNDDGDPIINHPEVGILGVGVTRRRPWVVVDEAGDERIEIRDIARFTLAFDHRVCDGGEAGRFVTMVADLCERPQRLLYF